MSLVNTNHLENGTGGGLAVPKRGTLPVLSRICGQRHRFWVL